MIILDTNVISHVQKKDPFGLQIEAALAASPDQEFRITTPTVYEILEGGVSLLDRQYKARKDMTSALHLFDTLVEAITTWSGLILPYDEEADRIHRSFSPRIRQELGDDAWIAAIAKVHDATVWTRNVRDFARIPDLAVVDATTGLPITHPTG